MSKYPVTEATPGNIETQVAAIATDAAATEVLDTARNALLTTMDADTSAMAVDLAAIEVLDTARNALLTTMDADTSAMAVDLAAIEVINTAIQTAVEACQTSLAIIDEWNNSERCQTSPIDGQLGIAGNTGAVSTNTTRVTLATDDPAVTALQVMDDWDSSDHCKTYPHAEYTETALASVTADNGTPSGTNGVALQSDTVNAAVTVVAQANVTNADINLWFRQRGTSVWKLLPGGAMDDLQDQTGDCYDWTLPGIGLYADYVYCEIDNYATAGGGTDTISAYLIESTV